MNNIQLPDYQSAKILVIGDIMLDRYWFGETARISPEAPVPVVKINQMDERPGGAGNVALNIASLGSTVNLIGVTGVDEKAANLKKQLSDAHVNYDIHTLQNIPTITKLRIISRHQQLLRLDFEEKIPTFNQKSIISIYKKYLAETQLVILSDYNKGTINCADELIKLANDAGIPVFVDPKGLDFSIYRNATLITPNLKEFEAIVGPCKNEEDIINKAKKLLNEFNIESMLLTRGEHGMTLIQKNDDEVHLPAHAREVYDVTGAGDTVIAVLAATYAAGATLTDAMKIANLAASLVVAKLGAAYVDPSELKIALQGSAVSKRGILNEEELLDAVSHARSMGKKIVFTNGCFDILHAGHVTYLQQAKQLGDFLIVAINTDDSIKKIKGTNRPINNVEHRLALLASLNMVDAVISFADDTPERLLKKLQPHLLVKGGDYQTHEVVGADIVFAYGGEVRVLGLTKNISTTKIIERVINKHLTTEVN